MRMPMENGAKRGKEEEGPDVNGKKSKCGIGALLDDGEEGGDSVSSEGEPEEERKAKAHVRWVGENTH